MNQLADLNQWIPVATVAVTGVTTLAATLLGQWMTSYREQKGKRLEGAERRQQQFFDYQLTTMLDLQEALATSIDAAIAMADIEYHTIFNGLKINVRRNMVLAKKLQQAGAKAVILSVRVHDLEIRKAVKELHQLAGELMIPPHFKLPEKGREQITEETLQLRRTVIDKFHALNDRIGDLILQNR